MHEPIKTRRQFLQTVGALGAVSIFAGSGETRANSTEGQEKLAIEGGTPVRKIALHSRPYGPQFYDDVEKRELLEVLESKNPFRWWGGNSKVLQFEKAYAAHIGVKYAMAVTSGTTALYTAMAGIGIGPGDEVILPAWTWYADYDAVVLSGALPVFAEIDESFAIDPQDIEARITPRTKAIVPSHLQGGVADLDAILAIARKHKLLVVEDCAQCAGGRYKGKYVGSIADMGINSFQLSKTITSGEGGAVTTNDPKLFERALRFHDVGMIRSPYAESLGGGLLAAFAACNFRMNEFTGAVLKGQLQKLETICARLRGARPQGPRGDCRPARTQTPQVGGPRGRPGLGSLPGPGHEEAARQVPARHGCGGSAGVAARRLGDPAYRPADREEVDDPPRLAFLSNSRRQGHPLRQARPARGRSTFSAGRPA